MFSKLDIFVVDPIELQIQKSKTKNKFGAFLTIAICFICIIAFVLLTILNELKQPIITTEIISTSTLNQPVNAKIEWNTDLVDISTIHSFDMITENSKNTDCIQNINNTNNINSTGLCYFSKDLIGEENGTGFVFKLKLKNKLKPLLPFSSTDSIFFNFDNRYFYIRQMIKNRVCLYDILEYTKYCFYHNSVYLSNYITPNYFYFNNTNYVSINDNLGNVYLFKNHTIFKIDKVDTNYKDIIHYNENDKYFYNETSLTIININNINLNIPINKTTYTNNLFHFKYTNNTQFNNLQIIDPIVNNNTNELILNFTDYFIFNFTNITTNNFALSVSLYEQELIFDNSTYFSYTIIYDTLYIIVQNLNNQLLLIKTINLYSYQVFTNKIYFNDNTIAKYNNIFFISFSIGKSYNSILSLMDASKKYLFLINKDASYIRVNDLTNKNRGFLNSITGVDQISSSNYLFYTLTNTFPIQFNDWSKTINTRGVLNCSINPDMKNTLITQTLNCVSPFTNSFNINTEDNINLNQQVASIVINGINENSIIPLTIKDVLGFTNIKHDYKINLYTIVKNNDNYNINKNSYKTLYKFNTLVLDNNEKILSNAFASEDNYISKYLLQFDNLNTGHDIKYNCITTLDNNYRPSTFSNAMVLIMQNEIDCPFYNLLNIPLLFDNELIYFNNKGNRFDDKSTNLTGIFLLNLNDNFYLSKSTPTKDSIFKIIGSIGGIFSSLLTAFMFIKNTWWKKQHKHLFSLIEKDKNIEKLSEVVISNNELNNELDNVKYIHQIDDTINIQLAKLRNENSTSILNTNKLYN